MSTFEIGEKVDVKVWMEEAFIENPRHPRLISIEKIMSQSGLEPHDWIHYIEDIDGEKDCWFEVIEVSMPILDDTFKDENEQILQDMGTPSQRRRCPAVVTLLMRRTSLAHVRNSTTPSVTSRVWLQRPESR